MRKILITGFFVMAIVLMAYPLKANFACGKVNSYGNVSPNWMNVIVYYQEKPLEISTCKINPEKKFCCDLDQIKSVKFLPNKTIFAEVYDNYSGYVSDKVSIKTSANGYDIFPETEISPAIEISQKIRKIMVGNCSLKLNITLNGDYHNLKYELISMNKTIQETACENCNKSYLEINLSGGKNTLKLNAYDDLRSISKKREIYCLNYLKIETGIKCKKCKKNIVPANTPMNFTIKINASDNISADLKTYFPDDWEYSGESQQIDESHSVIVKEIKGNLIKEILQFKSPNIFLPRKYSFKTDLEGIVNKTEVLIYRFFPLFFFKKNYDFSISLARYFAGPNEPLVIQPNAEFIEAIAIYPKTKQMLSAGIIEKYSFFKRKWDFKILLNCQENKIKQTEIYIKIKENSKLYFKDKNGDDLSLDFIKKEGQYNYYKAYLDSKEFYVKKRLF